MFCLGDPEAALIEYDSHAAARNAYQCPDAVLGNRFIKVFWHTKDKQVTDGQKDSVENNGKQTSSDNSEPHRKSVKERLAPRPEPPTEDEDAPPAPKSQPPVTNPKLLKKSNIVEKRGDIAPTAEQIAVGQAPIFRTRAEMKSEKTKKLIEVQKKLHTMLEDVRKTQKALFGRIDKAKTAEEKKSITITIKELDIKAKNFERDILSNNEKILGVKVNRNENNPNFRSSRVVKDKKEVLDVDIDNYNQQKDVE